MLRRAIALLPLALLVPSAAAQDFVNWESPHVHPLDRTPDGKHLLAVNTADARLEVFTLGAAGPVHRASIPVGLDPVSVRARSDSEVWVVNHVSDSISVVNLTALHVVATLRTLDEPTDVVFAGKDERAYVSCSQVNALQVFDPADPAAEPQRIDLVGEEPKSLAVSPDGLTVYAAFFESGNGTTILAGGFDLTIDFLPNVVSDPDTPYGGVNPPPNDGAGFDPPRPAAQPEPPRVGLIVREDDQGRWRDDNGSDWTEFVSGSLAARSGRPVGWGLYDHDLAALDTQTGEVTYTRRLMNHCMAVSVHPKTGDVMMVGTDALNEVRFEPVINGRFLRVNLARVSGGATKVSDLNPHLDYQSERVPLAQRRRTLGDPRGIAWSADGQRGLVTGMGSNNVVPVDGSGQRLSKVEPIAVGEGPTGVVFDDERRRAYVLNRFDASLSTIDLSSLSEVGRVAFFDPTPEAIRRGRKHLYDTHHSSGLGLTSCGSCHTDARMDRLGWDLGDPGGMPKPVDEQHTPNTLSGGTPFEAWHPMKGPMTTQTLQDIVGKEPHHWRGDRDGIEEFNGAFEGLLGREHLLTDEEMQEFEDFLASIHFPPNPFRTFTNRLPTNLPLTGHVSTGRFSPPGTPLPDGNARNGRTLYRLPNRLDGGALACSSCHTLPTGMGTNHDLDGGAPLQPLPAGPDGELRHALVSVDGSTNVTMKVPHLRNLYEKVGCDFTQGTNLSGFGFLHDGSIDSLVRFLAVDAFELDDDQELADLTAFMLAFSGSNLPSGSTAQVLQAPGPLSQDTHAGVGFQLTYVGTPDPDSFEARRLTAMLNGAAQDFFGLVAHQTAGGVSRGYALIGPDLFQSDVEGELVDSATLVANSGPGRELTVMVVPEGTEVRLGLDRDRDGVFDGDERLAGTDAADPDSFPEPDRGSRLGPRAVGQRR